VGYRIVFGDDLKARIKKAVSLKFPNIFPRESTPDERRSFPDRTFVTDYYRLAGEISKSSSIPGLNLAKSENEIRLIAQPLFDIYEDKVPEDLTNSRWFNFVLYARLHVLAEALKTPSARGIYAGKLAAQTFPLTEANSAFFLDDIDNLMKRLQTLGWISGYKMTDFDALDWDEIGTSKLSVYANDPYPLQTAQLLGEEDTPEVSPVISAWISIILENHGIVATYEDYYLDDQYRPDPVDFMPSQIVTTFDLKKSE